MKAGRSVLITVFLLGTMGKTLFAQTIDPADNNANYQKALTLYRSGAAAEGIAYLENIFKNTSTIKPAAYDLLGNIYDQLKQPDKAIAAYNEGIKLDPNYQNLRFNLGLAYFRIKKYAEAELSAIEAIKLDPKHANSQRLYGLVAFHQNKRVNALLAFCSFLLLDPQNQRAEEACTNIQSILKGGILKTEPGVTTTNKDELALNKGLSAIIAAGKTKNLQPAALLEYQLKNIFIMAGQLSAKKTDKSFFDKYYADFLYRLAQSEQLSTFVKCVSLSGEKDAYLNWAATHSLEVSDLNNWVNATPR
jgi:tetratricopeptide (TPR) repeat protein